MLKYISLLSCYDGTTLTKIFEIFVVVLIILSGKISPLFPVLRLPKDSLKIFTEDKDKGEGQNSKVETLNVTWTFRGREL